MKVSHFTRILLIGLIVLVLPTGIVNGGPIYADNHCKKNHDNNCNQPDKSQKSNPKINCEIHIDATDGTNNDFGPNNQQCQSNNNNIKDSTVTINSPGNNGNQGRFIVVSTAPKDGDNNVALDTDVTVKFSGNINKNTIGAGSLALVNLDQTIDPDVQDVTVSGNSATFTLGSTSGGQALLPNTRYEATISSNINDENGDSLDCANSKGVDSNCQWQFSTSGGSPSITLNPTSGPVLTSVDIDGTGFDPLTSVTITFGGVTLGTLQTTSTGAFSGRFIVPITSPLGDQTVKASQGSNSASKTFKVTALVNPIIFLDPTSGPVGTPVDIAGAGFDPDSTVSISFNGTIVTTTPTPLKTDNHGLFFDANFSVPTSSPGVVQVVATEGSKSASEPFNVTLATSSVTTTKTNLGVPEIPGSVASLIPTSPF